MVEYGGGINEGPAGQVGGGGAPSMSYDDPFANVSHLLNDGVNFIMAQPLEVLVAAFFVALIGLVILKRAF